jgi:hypothetical protein
LDSGLLEKPELSENSVVIDLSLKNNRVFRSYGSQHNSNVIPGKLAIASATRNPEI